MKPAIGVVRFSGPASISMPRGGRALVIAKAIPAAFSLPTAAMARGVSTLSWVTIVPSTSEIRAEIFAGFGRGLTANLLRL